MAKAADSVHKDEKPSIAAKESYRVRLRGVNYALSGSINGTTATGKPVEERWSLQPNRWTEVSKRVFEFLKEKYDKVREYEVPHWEPGGDGQRAEATPYVEEVQPYIIEFK